MHALNPSVADRACLHHRAPAALALLASGERLALEAALATARLSQAPDLQRMFSRQAAQEARHLQFFLLAGRAWGHDAGMRPTHDAIDAWARSDLARCIDDAREAGDLLGLVVATQGVLEAVGASALVLVEEQLAASPARWLLRSILREERAHQRIGERALGRLIANRPRCAEHVEAAFGAFVPAGATMIDAIGEHLAVGVTAQVRLRAGFTDAIDAFRGGIALECRRLTVSPARGAVDGPHAGAT